MTITHGWFIMMGLLFAGCMVESGLDNIARQVQHVTVTVVEAKH